MAKFAFGSFNGLCQTAALVVCPLVGTDQGVTPTCYSRNIDVGGVVFFQPATVVIHVVAIIMTIIMILHISSKYTAVGRKEIVMFFWIYAVIELLAIFLDSGVIPTAHAVYPWAAAVYTGLVAGAYCCLLINGFVGFQFAEDGTALSLWLLRISCLLLFAVGFFLAVASFKDIVGFSHKNPIALWIIYILWPMICVAVYVVSQLVLVFRTLEDRWPIGDIIFGISFWVVGMVLQFAFSTTICDTIKHYIDGLFFSELCVLLAVMMVYKYWDSITREDLEFSVGSKQAVWEVKDPLLADDGPGEYPGGGGYGSVPGGNYGYNSASSVGLGQQYQQKAGYSAGGRAGYPPSGGY